MRMMIDQRLKKINYIYWYNVYQRSVQQSASSFNKARPSSAKRVLVQKTLQHLVIIFNMLLIGLANNQYTCTIYMNIKYVGADLRSELDKISV